MGVIDQFPCIGQRKNKIIFVGRLFLRIYSLFAEKVCMHACSCPVRIEYFYIKFSTIYRFTEISSDLYLQNMNIFYSLMDSYEMHIEFVNFVITKLEYRQKSGHVVSQDMIVWNRAEGIVLCCCLSLC